MKIALLMLLLWFFSPLLFSQLYISPNAVVTFSANSLVTINTNLEIGSGAILTQNSFGTIYISGNWNNNGTFNPDSGVVIFYSGNNSTISGSSTTTFYDLHINKNASAIVLIGGDTTVNDTLLVQNGILWCGVDALAVRGSVINNATIYNEGVIEIGICP